MFRSKRCVQGSVFDETRAVLPGVTITLRNDATGVTNIFVTNELGHYIFDFVDPGLYRITAELPGFKKAEQLNVPELNISSTNFGKVTRKRADGSGREIQAGLRFVF